MTDGWIVAHTVEQRVAENSLCRNRHKPKRFEWLFRLAQSPEDPIPTAEKVALAFESQVIFHGPKSSSQLRQPVEEFKFVLMEQTLTVYEEPKVQ